LAKPLVDAPGMQPLQAGGLRIDDLTFWIMSAAGGNEPPRGLPRGIHDRNPEELRSKPRFLHSLQMRKAG
jgi:hypothetical protein